MPGISVSKICVPFGGGGINWSSYWATRTPTTFTQNNLSSTSIKLDWVNAATDIDGHSVEQSTDGVTYAEINAPEVGTNTYTVTGLTAGGLYYFRVRAKKDDQYSPYTDVYDTRFKITVDTTKAGSAADTFVLPCISSGYNAYVDWGDGGAEQNITGSPGNVSHTYAAPGTYQIKIRGVFGRIYFNNTGDCLKLMSIDNWGNKAWLGFISSFRGCANMEGTYTDIPNTTAVTEMTTTFGNCAKFNSAVGFNTANVTNMAQMFQGCTIFNQSVASFNTAKVTNMASMFFECLAFNQDVSNFNTALVTTMAYMFYKCYAFNQDVSGWNIEKVANMTSMFQNANLLSTSNYDKLLIAWGAQNVTNTVTFHAGDALYTDGGDAEAARTHLATATGDGGHGWTITDGGKAFDKGKVIITFDDGRASQYTACQTLISKGITGTIFVVGDLVGTAGHVTWANLQALNGDGIDLQCHTKSHPNLTLLSEAQIDAELTGNDALFVANSLSAPTIVAYPAGAYNTNVMTYVADNRDMGRCTETAYTTRNYDKYKLPCVSIDYRPGQIPRTAAEMEAFIDYAESEKCALIILLHEVGTDYRYMSSAEFETMLDYIIAADVDVITMAQLKSLMT